MIVPDINLLVYAYDSVGTGGNLCSDAVIAALAEEHGGRVHSTDADFARFSGVSWCNPLKDGG